MPNFQKTYSFGAKRYRPGQVISEKFAEIRRYKASETIPFGVAVQYDNKSGFVTSTIKKGVIDRNASLSGDALITNGFYVLGKQVDADELTAIKNGSTRKFYLNGKSADVQTDNNLTWDLLEDRIVSAIQSLTIDDEFDNGGINVERLPNANFIPVNDRERFEIGLYSKFARATDFYFPASTDSNINNSINGHLALTSDTNFRSHSNNPFAKGFLGISTIDVSNPNGQYEKGEWVNVITKGFIAVENPLKGVNLVGTKQFISGKYIGCNKDSGQLQGVEPDGNIDVLLPVISWETLASFNNFNTVLVEVINTTLD